MPDKPTKAKKRLKDSEIFVLVAEYERQAEIEGRAKKTKKGIQDSICEELQIRGTTSLTADDGTKVTRVQTENINIDGDALYGDLKPAQRRLAYRRSLVLSELPAEVQRALMDVLKTNGVASAVNVALDTSGLAAAVQEGKIDAEIVAKHTTITMNAPYIRPSHGTGD
jgi:hypothetical protein